MLNLCLCKTITKISSLMDYFAHQYHPLGAPIDYRSGFLGGTCEGPVGFFSVYDGYMTPAQRKAAVKVGSEIMSSRA